MEVVEADAYTVIEQVRLQAYIQAAGSLPLYLSITDAREGKP